MKIVVFFDRFGPYHVARLNAANSENHICGVELTAVDHVYKWERVGDDSISFDRINIGANAFAVSTASRGRVREVLASIGPDAVAIPGWSEQSSLYALLWCLDNGVPAVLMSESTEHDEPRKWWKEFIKKRIISCCSAALVGGKPHVAYMKRLGMSQDRIFTGYDVVDNDYFAKGAAKARASRYELRKKFDLPEQYFLSSNRFIAKKNLSRLINAYSLYRQRMGADAWNLVILGDGELRLELEELISELGLHDDVLLPGFKQYPDLPVYYGLASAYVHASTTEQWGLVVNEAMAAGLPVIVSERCGCAPDLVADGENGFVFDPYDVDLLSNLMLKISAKQAGLENMGKKSSEMISKLSPVAFAKGLAKASERASFLPKTGGNFWDRFVVRLLALQ